MALDVYKDWLGIPEGPRPPDHYQLLRLVQFEDDVEKVRKNYRKLNAHARKYASGQYSLQSQELLNELAKVMLCLTDSERKREYDESLGREFEEEPGLLGRKPLLNWLCDQEAITAEQAKEVQDFGNVRGLSERDAVVQMKLVDAETAAQALSQELGRPYVDLAELAPDDSVLDKVPRNVVKRNRILPLFVDDDVLLVACVHEPTPELEEELRLRFGMAMRPVMATPLAINQAIAKHYAPGMRTEVADEPVSSAKASKSQRKAKQKSTQHSQLSSGEKAQRKQIGILLMCWAFIGSILFDEFVLKAYLLPTALAFPYVPSLTTLIVPPIVIYYVLSVYWK